MRKFLVAGTAIALGGIFVLSAQQAAPVSGKTSAATTSALVQKYCEVCHDDAHLNGGLSLEHFDAANADPTIAAMLLSKLTNGLPLEKVSKANDDPAAAAAIDTEMKSSAIGAAGLPAPDRATSHALVMALSSIAGHAADWTVNQTSIPESQAKLLTASIIREVVAANDPTRMDMYRLTLTCRADNWEGDMQLAWAPGGPKNGRAISVSVDGSELYSGADLEYGKGVNGGPGAALFYATKDSFGRLKFPMPLPKETLGFTNLSPGNAVVFPFGGLAQEVRHSLSRCFTGVGSGS